MQKTLIVASLAVLLILVACAKQAPVQEVSSADLSEIDAASAQVDQLDSVDVNELDQLDSDLVELENLDVS